MNAQNLHPVARHLSLLFCLLVGLLPARRATAQNPDTAREVQELAKRIEIDQLLLDSGKKNQAREKPKEMLQQSIERGREVTTGIKELIDKLNEMKNQSSSSSQSDSQDQKPKDQQDQKPGQQQQQGQQQRRENQNPDFVQQPKDGQQQQQGEQQQGEQPKPGQEGQQPQPAGQKPQDGQEQKTAGENRTGSQLPPDETGPGKPGQGSESWGELQGYTNFLKNRGSPPKVPEKYRKYWEAYLKNKQGTQPTGGGK
jgi:hypothetical protein